MIGFALDALISFSMVPLRIATYVGALLTTGLTLIGIYAVIIWILSGAVPGWTSLTLLVVILLGPASRARADRGICRPHLYSIEEPSAVPDLAHSPARPAAARRGQTAGTIWNRCR